MFRTFWKFVGVAVMALAVSAPVSHAKQRLLMGTSTGGGSYYVLGGTWSNALNGRLGDKVDLSIEVTGGPETNIMLIENKEMDLGMVTAWQAGDMYNGKGKVPQKFQAMRSFIPLYPSYLQIYALADSGLKTIHDIDGKHVASSSAGSSSFLAARAIIETLGLKPAKVSGMPASQRSIPCVTARRRRLFRYGRPRSRHHGNGSIQRDQSADHDAGRLQQAARGLSLLGRRALSPRAPTRPPKRISTSFPCGTSPWPIRISLKSSSTT